MRLSGLQKEVLSLYRNCLRESRKKPTKGSPHRRPKITYPSPAVPIEKPTQPAAEPIFHSPFPEPLPRELQRQRRISRKKNGIRVSRRLSPRETGRSTAAVGDNQYSLMQVSEFTEDRPYWSTLQQPQVFNAKPTAGNDIRSSKNHGHIQTAANHKPPTQRLDHKGPKLRGRRRKGMSIANRNEGKIRQKRFGLADPVVWDAINRSLTQQRQLSSLIVPEVPVTQAIPDLEVPSRTSSQHKALNRFTRKLEKYADVSGAATSNVPVMTPTESESKNSYHTVQPLMPFRKEFQAAGLAVTSAEQGRVSPTGGHACVEHPSESTERLVGINGEFDGQEDPTAEPLSSSSGSYIEFTPYGGPAELSSLPKSKMLQKSTYKEKRGILPWLRKKPTVEEIREFEPQEQWQPIRDGRVQSGMRGKDAQNPRDHRTSVHQEQPARVIYPSTPTTQPVKLPSASNLNTPQKPSYILTGAKQSNRGRRSEPIISYTNPEAGMRQPVVYTGLRKRDITMARLPRPETIEEEQEISPSHTNQTIIKESPHSEVRISSIPAAEIKPSPQNISSHTTPSSVPSLPYPARYASGRLSSLERALEEVSQQLDKMEQEADKTAEYHRPPTLVETTNHKEQKKETSSCHQVQQAPKPVLPRRPHKAEKVMYVDRKMPSVSPKQKTKPAQSLSGSPSRPPTRTTQTATALTPTRSKPLPSRPKEKMLPRTPQTKDVQNDAKVFLDYEDADISDRDVIKGLQVAIRAAADDSYDALIRDKTGLRIRRFLADLRAVGEMPQENS
ncbi:hypothetical protein GGR53DRAFT_522080 [Hypoxylon sp. FL1150]|nr:hypothetical protein GGR53DRAFT_522080 [Hypoxylon sp. FL1150]